MLLTIFAILLIVNVIGFMNRKRAWAKIYMVAQVFVVAGMAVMFNMSSFQTGIEGMEAKDQNGVKEMRDMVKENKAANDTADVERETQGGNQVKSW
jgi:hypothetical protein